MSLAHQYLVCIAIFLVIPSIYLIKPNTMKNRISIETIFTLLGFVIFCVGGLVQSSLVMNVAGCFSAFFGAILLVRLNRRYR